MALYHMEFLSIVPQVCLRLEPCFGMQEFPFGLQSKGFSEI